LVKRLVEKHFKGKNLRLIGDAGVNIAEDCAYIVSQITGTKIMKTGEHHYYVNGGLFQGYILRQNTGKVFAVHPLDKKVEKRQQFKTTWWGQTCDSYDFIIKDVMQPKYMTDEWVISKNHGLYNTSIVC
jgi:diaminopimelate decarboxylase